VLHFLLAKENDAFLNVLVLHFLLTYENDAFEVSMISVSIQAAVVLMLLSQLLIRVICLDDISY
jgi:hypothetical protein